jgi:hypothetical protein
VKLAGGAERADDGRPRDKSEISNNGHEMRDGSLQQLAEANWLRIKRDDCNDQVIPGKLGDVWEDDERMAVTIYEDLPDREITKRKWTYCKRACLGVGMTLEQDGDREGTLLFDPGNAEQVETAIRAARIKKKRIMSPAQTEVLARARESSPIMRKEGFQRCESTRRAS